MIYIIRPDNNVLANLMNDLGNLNPKMSWKVEVKEYRQKRSNNQNALYWKWLNILGDELGYTTEELHEAIKSKFLGKETRKTIFGEEYEALKSTTKLNTKDFSELMNKVEQLALMHDIRLPSPDYYGL